MLIDLTGKTFGRLKVLSRDRTKKPGTYWICVCNCGIKKSINAGSLKNGSSRSCGCLSREKSVARLTKHGLADTPIHGIWVRMNQRCHNPNSRAYARYGGRGIKVCDRWRGKNGFASFISDVGMRPSSKHSLDRIDNDGDYCPENVRWATAKEQGNNKRNNILLTYKGKKLTVAQWSRELGISAMNIRNRIGNLGWSVEKALSTPVRTVSKRNKKSKNTKNYD